MGSLLSPIIADIVLQDLEEKVLTSLNFILSFYLRYVDDIVLSAPPSAFEHILNVFNSFHSRLQFEGTVMGLIDRAFRFSHPQFHKKNFNFIINILLNNNHPLDFIFSTLHNNLKYLFNNHNKNNHSLSNEIEETIKIEKFFTIPYVPSISKRFKSITKDLDVRLFYFSLNKLHRFIKVHKDQIPKASSSNIIYKINCDNCDASIKKHRNYIRRNTPSHSVITDHRLRHNHEFKWNNVKILDIELIYNKRLISEMLFIKRQNNSLNLPILRAYMRCVCQ
ncbi:hypothetical protein ACFW04_006577 [Cataglyphis niger]